MNERVLCRDCGKPCQRMPNLVPKHVAFGCRVCGIACLADDGRWVSGGNWGAQLAELAKGNDRSGTSIRK